MTAQTRPTAHTALPRRMAGVPRALALMATVLLLTLSGSPAGAQTAPGETDVLASIVGIDTEVPPNARTADTLGTRRQGSGIVISEDGLVVTIGYLVMEAAVIDLELAGGRTVPAEMIAYDHESGLGLVRALAPLGVPPVELGSAAALEVRSPALIANRLGTEGAQGVFVVDRREFAGAWEYLLEGAIFTSPPSLNFSGAALLDGEGRLVGIGYLFVGAAAVFDRPVPGNMFVPVDELTAVLDDLVDDGRRAAPARPWLGIYTAELRDHVVIERVAEGGPAARSGLAPGDVILSVDGTPVRDVAGYLRAVWDGRRAGDPVDMKILNPSSGARSIRVPSMDRRDWLRLDPTF